MPQNEAGSFAHVSAYRAAELEQPLLDEHGHLAGKRDRLLALGEDPHVPLMALVGRSQLRAGPLVGCGLLLEVSELRRLPFDLGRPRLLALLKALDAVDHGGAIAVGRVDEAGE